MKSNDEYYFGDPLEVPGEPLKSPPPAPRPAKKRPHFSIKKLLGVLSILILLLGLAYGGWKMFGQKDAAPVAHESQTNAAAPPAQPQTNQISGDVPEAKGTKTFKGDHPRISFDYPDTWTITEKENGVRIESPTFKYKTIDTGELEGNFRLYIRQQARTSDSKYIGRAIAVQPSEKLIYKQPVVGQLPETNLIHFGLDSTDHFAFLFVAGNYALQKNDTLGPEYGKELEAYIITGGYSSKDLTEDMATHKVSLDFYDETNAFKQAMEILQSLKLL